MVWECIKREHQTSVTEAVENWKQKQHNPCFDEDCWKLPCQGNVAKLQWFQNPCQMNGDNLMYVKLVDI